MEPENLTPPISPEKSDLQSTPLNSSVPQRKSFIFPITILIALISLGTAGYFAYKNYQLRRQTSQANSSTTPSPAEAPAKEGDPTGNWKMYKDDKNGIEFKYPDTWYAKPYMSLTFSVFLDNHPIKNPTGTEVLPASILVGFNEVTNTQTNQNYFLEKTLGEGIKRVKSGYNQASVRVVENLTVGGNKAAQISGVLAPGIQEGEYFKETLVQLDGKLLMITLHGKENENIYNQILSTFKFTDQNLNSDISNWKTYSNSLGYSFRYPSTWVTRNIAAGAGEGPARPDSRQVEVFNPQVDRKVSGGVLTIQSLGLLPSYDNSWKKSDRTINGIKFSSYQKSLEGGFRSIIYTVSISTDSHFEIQYTHISDDQKATFDQILSTFKFLN